MQSITIATQIYAKLSFQPTENQKKIIESFSNYLSDDDFSRFFVLNGYAGTGKTTLIAAIVAALKMLGSRSKSPITIYIREGTYHPQKNIQGADKCSI